MHQAEKAGQNIPTDSVNPSQLVRWGGIEITTSPQKWQELAYQYAIPNELPRSKLTGYQMSNLS